MSQHLTDGQMNDVIDSRLPLGERQAVMGHLDNCDDCRSALHRLGGVVRLAPELQRPAVPSRDLWPALSRKTVHSKSIRGPWLFTLILAVLTISGTSVWLERTRPWERVTTQIVSEPAYQASDPEILRLLASLQPTVSDADRRKELDRLAPAVFKSTDPTVHLQFFRSVRAIKSAGEKRRLLMMLLPYAVDTLATAAMIEAAREISSTSQRAEVLASIADQPVMQNQALRLLYLDAVEEIDSNRDKALARSALLARDR
jgi:hypothetical protein